MSNHPRLPVRIEILSPAENVSLLENDLRDILTDSRDSCEYDAFVDKDGTTKIKIECTVDDEEKQNAWIRLQSKHSTDCSLSVEPIESP